MSDKKVLIPDRFIVWGWFLSVILIVITGIFVFGYFDQSESIQQLGGTPEITEPEKLIADTELSNPKPKYPVKSITAPDGEIFEGGSRLNEFDKKYCNNEYASYGYEAPSNCKT